MTSVVLIGDYAFYYCIGLESSVIPNTVTKIGTNCFDSCYSLTSVTLPDSINTIYGWTFSGMSPTFVKTTGHVGVSIAI
jgi:hypothetical protein